MMGANPTNLTAAGNTLFFQGYDGVHGMELWASDGTETGTRMVKELRPGELGAQISNLTAVGDQVFFTANDGTHGYDLWMSDGTANGTRMVKDVTDDDAWTAPSALGTVGKTLFFNATDSQQNQVVFSFNTDTSDLVRIGSATPVQLSYDPYDSHNPVNIVSLLTGC